MAQNYSEDHAVG